VPQARPDTVADVDCVTVDFVPTDTSYPATAMLSLDAAHVSETEDAVAEETRSDAGADGACVSPVPEGVVVVTAFVVVTVVVVEPPPEGVLGVFGALVVVVVVVVVAVLVLSGIPLPVVVVVVLPPLLPLTWESFLR
jgi:hypothetical protein